MATLLKAESWHDVNVETYKCSECDQEFPSVGPCDYCPNCGEYFDSSKDTEE